MSDNDIINNLFNRKQIKWKFLDNNIKQYLLNRYDDNYSSCEKLILKESYYRILNNIEKCPICPICGNKCKFLYFSYSKTCGSPKCLAKECQKRREETNFERYGYSCQFGNKEILDKAKQTIISKYNVDNVFKLKEIREKSYKTKLEKYGNKHYHNQEKIKQTCLERYNSTSPLGNKEIWEQTRKHTIEKYGAAYNKEKYNDTMLTKYGVKWFTQTKKLIDAAQSKEAKEKQYKTKKKNNSFNTSKIESKSYIFLKNKYPDVINQYKSDLYPFNCDFYIPSLDLYIECNYHWTHGGHPYNENNKNDIETLNKWKEKDTKFYANAITTWTIRDVNKRNIAKQNKLNYIEFWNIEELKIWINNGK